MSASARLLGPALALGLAAAMAATLPVSGLPVRTGPAGARVQSMIAGRAGAILFASRPLRASATSVKVGRRRCAVAAGTPLAVLAAAHRAGGPAFLVRDYGHCGPSPASSGELFVYSLGGEANSGANGWEYKVDGAAGSTGAGDPAGPDGNGERLRNGEHVLWFWCVASGTGCERSLEVTASATRVTASGALAVTVRGFDNEGRAAAAPGATVTLGGDSAVTDASGRATVAAPALPGHYALDAVAPAMVPSFPETIAVG